LIQGELSMTRDALPDRIGRYEVERVLGHGAMGRVILARDPVLDRSVAIKLLRSDLPLPPEQRAALFDRMRHEARASARVSHPNIVALHDMGDDPELGLYLVFEYAEGATLKDRLEQTRMGPEACAKLAREVGGALSTAHRAGVLHRDIKPENIILTKTGAKVADFGIARVPDSTLTRDGGVLGTPAYAAPEALHRGAFSPLSDQFSFAATLYEAVSGRRAFPGDDAVAVATLITTTQPPGMAILCGLDEDVDEVVLRAMAQQPGERFASAEEFANALSEALLLSPRSSMQTMPDQHHTRADAEHAHRRELVAGIGGALVGAGVVACVFMLIPSSNEPLVVPSAIPAVSEDPPAASAPEPSVVPTRRHKTRDETPERETHAAGEAGVVGDGGVPTTVEEARDAETPPRDAEKPQP
jgi:serine/threonine-protein kinase